MLLTMWLLIASLCISILSLSPENPLLLLVYTLTKEWIEKIILILLLVLIGLMLSLFILHRKNKEKIKIQEFNFVDPPGYYTHPEYSYPICPSCLIKNNLKSPVSKEGYCTVCKEPISGTLVSGGEVFTEPYHDIQNHIITCYVLKKLMSSSLRKRIFP